MRWRVDFELRERAAGTHGGVSVQKRELVFHLSHPHPSQMLRVTPRFSISVVFISYHVFISHTQSKTSTAQETGAGPQRSTPPRCALIANARNSTPDARDCIDWCMDSAGPRCAANNDWRGCRRARGSVRSSKAKGSFLGAVHFYQQVTAL